MSKKKQHILLFIILAVVFGMTLVSVFPVHAEFVPYEIEEKEREILGNEQYTDYEANKTFIKYNYIGVAVPSLQAEKIISPNTEQIAENKFKIYSGNQFIQSNLEWKYLEYATSTVENFNILTKDLTFLQKLNPFSIRTVNADTIYSNAGDGQVYRGGQSTWSDAQDTIDGLTADYTNTTFQVSSDWVTGATPWNIRRAFLSFDTSALSGTVASSTISLYVTSKVNEEDDGDDWINIVEGQQANDTSLVTGDYDECGDAVDNPTEGATRIDIGDLSTSAYNTWTLNSTGEGWIDVSGYSKFGIREGHDTLDSAVTASGNPTYRRSRVNFSSSEETGTGQDPYLTVEMETAETGTSTASTTLESAPELLPLLDDITIFTSYVETYTTSTTSPSSYQIGYYRIPFIGFLIFAFIFLYIGGRLLLEMIIRWRA